MPFDDNPLKLSTPRTISNNKWSLPLEEPFLLFIQDQSGVKSTVPVTADSPVAILRVALSSPDQVSVPKYSSACVSALGLMVGSSRLAVHNAR